MAKHTTNVAGLTLDGIVPADAARERYRTFWQQQLDNARQRLERTELPITYWRGGTRISVSAPEAKVSSHSCANCLGFDPDTCLMNPDYPRAEES